MFPTVPSSSTFNDFKIGGNYLTSWTGSFSGSLGQLMVYNRVLSDDEIYSNYLIQARRYGLPEIPKPYTVDSSVYVYTQAAGITGSSTISALNTFVSGLKTAGLWDKMIAIYPFIGTSPSASRLNLKDVSLNTTQVNYSGSWSTSLSGSYNNNTASYGILSNITPTYVHPLINSQSIHLSYLSYDTPVSGGYLMGATTQVIASGGQVFEMSGSRFHVFTASANLTVSQGGNIQAFVVAGGGGAGNDNSGGGGAGGVVYSSSLSITSGIIPATVGTGGLGLVAGVSFQQQGQNSTFGSVVAVGGGRAGQNSSFVGGSGGSGGGGAIGGFSVGGAGTPGQGNSGSGDGGGGGAGTSGSGLNGGSGSYYPQYASLGFGSPAGWFGGGGGYGGQLSGTGGIGGGGAGGFYTSGSSGSVNTGGGGGASIYPQSGGSGGSGIIIISYPIITGSTFIQTNPTFISASANDTAGTGLTTGGPLGMITVSRTGSTAMALWKNRVPTKTTTRASASINLNFNLNSLNASDTSISASQITAGYVSVGAGLTDDEVGTYYNLVSKLQYDLGRGLLVEGFPAAAAYSVRQLSKTAQYSMEVRRDWDNASSSFGFITNGDLDTGSLLAFVTGSAGTGSGFVQTWYDQSGNNSHATQSTAAYQPLIVNSGSLYIQNSKPAVYFNGVAGTLLENTSYSLPTSTPVSFTAVVNPSSSNNALAGLIGSNGGNGIMYYDTITWLMDGSGTNENNTANVTPNNNTTQLLTGIYTTSTTQNSYIFKNGTLGEYYTGGGVSRAGTGIQIGGRTGGGIPSRVLRGFIQEAIIFNSSIIDTRSTIESNINSYFNIY
jgi:hypothetical protein